MKNKKQCLLGLVIAIITLISGISYAYFTATFQNLGVRETSITAAEMGSLKLTATEATYTSGNQYPGDMAIQKFEVEPVTKGKGVYELDLTGVIDESIFGNDVEIQLYKSIDNTEVTVTEGDLTQDGSTFSRVDTLVTNGLTSIYNKALKNGLNILYQEEFEVIEESGVLKVRENSTSTAYPKYTFYLVYNYKNNGNQNNQMGQTFSGTISGKLIKEKKKTTGAETIAKIVDGSDPTSTAVIDKGTDASGCTNTLAYDDFGNLRYVGANPCNYVNFENEPPHLEQTSNSFASLALCENAINDSSSQLGDSEVLECKKSEEKDLYHIYADGDISTNSPRFGYQGGGEYPDLESCNQNLASIFPQNGIDGTIQCSQNTETGKYYMEAHGFFGENGFPPAAISEQACLENINSSGLSLNGQIPSGISCQPYSGYVIVKKVYSNLWRIIGVFDNQIKLIRSESIGNYLWDTSALSVNGGYGINQWGESGEYTGADLMKLLNPGFEENLAEDSDGNEITGTYANNSLYWNKGTGNCYNDRNNAYITCDFSVTGLTETAKSMIDKHTWNLGSQGSNDVWTDGNGLGLASKFYEYERSNNNGKICSSDFDCNDTVNRTTTWEGYVGLMYPSDYGYAVGGESRTNCLANTNLYGYGPDCRTNDWLFFDRISKWTMTPYANSSDAHDAFYIWYGVGYDQASGDRSVHPTLFLLPSITISGSGTTSDPYVVSLN